MDTYHSSPGKTTFHTVYWLEDIETGRFYIGRHSTNDLNDEYMGSGKRLGDRQKYIKHYIAIYSDSELMLIRESAEIARYIDTPGCLNCSVPDPVGDGLIQHSMYTRRKMSKSKTPEVRWANGSVWRGKKIPEIVRAKMRKPKPEGFGEKVSMPQRGRPKNPVSVEKMRATKTGKKLASDHVAAIKAAHATPETRLKNRLAHLGKKMSEKTKAKIAAGVRAAAAVRRANGSGSVPPFSSPASPP